MIGKITIGKSFKGCILYCLEDKIPEQEPEMVMKNRAEIILYNLCYGNKIELVKQFQEVRQLNPKLSKPVLHITLSLSPEDVLQKEKMPELVEECAKQMGFKNNQYIAVFHKDTRHQHIHIVANRVGFDGKTVSDSHNFKKIASYCRRMEEKYQLKQVLSPRRYLSKKERQIPRKDTRKEQLRENIMAALNQSYNYEEFSKKVKLAGYEIIKGRGIAFQDKQQVYVKGSEVGYSLQTIEKILLKQKLELKIDYKMNNQILMENKKLRVKTHL
jgi:hypothetical protein